MGIDGGDLQIVNIDISFVMSNYCNIAIFIAVELLGILRGLKVFYNATWRLRILPTYTNRV